MKALRTVIFATALSALPLLPRKTTVKHIQTDAAFIASGVWAGDTLYLSGQLASPIDPSRYSEGNARSVRRHASAGAQRAQEDPGDCCRRKGLDMKDVVKMTVFLAGDPAKGGKLDFPGLQASYLQFFGTKDQPNKPARSAVQVAALAAPWALIEIEVIAVKSK